MNYFEELPNIKSIDLSENLLIVLNLVAFTMNNNLRSVNVRGNRIKCDEHSEKSIIWLKKNHIEVAIDNCSKYMYIMNIFRNKIHIYSIKSA